MPRKIKLSFSESNEYNCLLNFKIKVLINLIFVLEQILQTLRKITYLKSPRDKLGCIVHTFMDVIQCVSDFWDAHERDPVVSADDLVPIFSYVILKANVPRLYSEMNFIWEFASDSEMKGKYGYSFATFQIGVEVISRLSQEEERKKQETLKKHEELPAVTIQESTEHPLDDSSVLIFSLLAYSFSPIHSWMILNQSENQILLQKEQKQKED